MRRALAAAVLAAMLSGVSGEPAIAVPIHPPGISRPSIVWWPIPFGRPRRQQMGAYSRRHYREWTWRLTDPHVIVEHYTDGTSFSGAFNAFAANGIHLGELPGVCAHFVIDTDGTVYQMVSLRIRCRHAIGMNWTAIGIEHVGTSDRSILSTPAMMRSSLRLTLWLMDRFDIQARNVIGHAETLMSPLHREAYPTWRCLTHADWSRAAMQVYRRRLRALAHDHGVPVGPRPSWVYPNC